MKTYYAKDIAQLNEDDLWNIQEEEFVLVFDDGEIVAKRKETIFSWYAWWACREWPEVPMMTQYHMGNNRLTGKTIMALMELCSWGAYDNSPAGSIDTEYLAYRIKEAENIFYNAMTTRLEEYVVSINALDFIDVIYHPEIVKITDHLQSLDLDAPGVAANMEYEIENAYEKARKIILTCTTLKGNRLVEAVKTKIVDIMQVLQCVVARGKLTDVDDNVFPRAIVRGLGHGLESFHDVLIESSSAKKALTLAKAPLAKVEYFNRQQQLSSETLAMLDGFTEFYGAHGIAAGDYHGVADCGSKGFVLWKVDKKNLVDLDGSYHWKDDGEMELIKPTSTHLVGRLIKLRTAMTCAHKNQYSICKTCFGDLSLNIPYGTNIAHASSVELCAKVSQRVLSTKHFDGTAVLDALRLNSSDRRYIKALPNQYEITLSSSLDKQKTKIKIPKEALWGLGDIHKVEDIDDLVPSRVTTMSDVIFEIVNEFDGIDYVVVPVSLGSRLSSFTIPFLKYLKEHGYETTNEGDIIVDLKEVPFDMPIWTLPRKHANMLEFMSAIEKLIKASDGTKSKGRMDLVDANSLSAALTDFYDLVSQKFGFSITHLAVMLRATMVRSKKDYDYRLPVGGQKAEFATFNSIMRMRSAGAYASFEKLPEMYNSPLSYLITQRPRHGFDEIYIPTPGAY